MSEHQKRSVLGNYCRETTIDHVDTDSRTVELSFSSETPYGRWFGDEILCHDEECINLERFNNGLGTVLFNHDRDAVVGHIEKVWIEDNRGKALVRFDTDEQSETIFQKVQSGTLQGVSVGYAVNRYEVLEDQDTKSTTGRFNGPAYVVTDWEPLEISIVSVPADATVGVGRSAEEIHTSIDTQEDNTRMDQEKNLEVQEVKSEPVNTGLTQEDLQKAMEQERKRTSEITAMFRDFDVEGADEAIVLGKSVEEARAMVMDQLRARNAGVSVKMGEAESDKFRAAAQDAVLMAAGIPVGEPAAGAQELRG